MSVLPTDQRTDASSGRKAPAWLLRNEGIGVALRPMLYGFGFLIFWTFAFISAALTAYMLQSGPHAPMRGGPRADRAGTP